MFRNFHLLLCLLLTFSVYSQSTIQSPTEYFTYYGKQHNFHHQILDYVKHIDEKSDMVMMKKFGETSQGRPLNLIFVSTAENIKNLEDIRLTNLYNSGVNTTKPTNSIFCKRFW